MVRAPRRKKKTEVDRNPRKRVKRLFTTKGWKFENLLEEVRKTVTNPEDHHVVVSAEGLAITFRAKIGMMSRVIARLRSEQILGHPSNYKHGPRRTNQWLPTHFYNVKHPYWAKVAKENEERMVGMQEEERLRSLLFNNG